MGRRAARAGARRLGLLAATTLALTTVAWGAGPAVGADEVAATVIDFEDYPAEISGRPAAPAVADHYAESGVILGDGVRALRFTDTSFPPAPGLPRSGEVVITSCYSREFCTSRIGMTFLRPLEQLTLFVGSSAALRAPAEVRLRAVDVNGAVVGEDSVTLPSGGLVPAVNPLTVADGGGRIVGAEVGWTDTGSFLGSLVVDDLTLTRFLPVAELTASPDQVDLTLGEDVVTTDVTITNTGNIPFGGLVAAFRADQEGADQEGTDTATEVLADQTGCNLGLAAGDECTVTLIVTPLREGTTSGAVEVSGLVRTSKVAQPILRVPVTLTVPPPPPPSSPSPSSTSSQTPTGGGTETTSTPTGGGVQTPPTSTTPDPGVEQPGLDWASLTENVSGPAVLMGVVLLGSLLVGTMLRRGRPRRTTRPRPASTEKPRLRIRPGNRRDTVAGPRGPVLTLVAVSPPAVTRVREDPR